MGNFFSSSSTYFFDNEDIWVEYDPTFGFIIGEFDSIIYLKYNGGHFQFDNSYRVDVIENKKLDMEVHIIIKNDIIYACSIWKKRQCIDLRTLNQIRNRKSNTN